MNRKTHLFSCRILLIVSIFLFGLCGHLMAADNVGSVNYYSDMMNDGAYSALLKYVFDGNPMEGMGGLYENLEKHMASAGYEEWKKDSFLARGALICAKYADDCKEKDIARSYMEIADRKIADTRTSGAPESAVGVLEALSFSFWYLVDGSLSKGMKFPGMVDDLYEEHPEDFHVLLLEADRYLHSPGIVGGNKKKGLQLYQEAEKRMNESGAAEWDRFSIYAGLAFGYDSRKDKENAEKYTLLASEIYTADETVDKLLKKYR